MAMTPQIKHDFARVTAHELAHIAGARGERWMRSSVAFGRRLKTDEEKTAQKERYAWVQEMPLEYKSEKPKASTDQKDSAKVIQIESLIKGWTTKKKRAETALAKHRKRLKYYQKKVAAQSAPSGATAQ